MGRRSRLKRERRRTKNPGVLVEEREIEPGIKMQRAGRFVGVQNERTPEEHVRHLEQRLRERPALLASIDADVLLIRKLLAEGSALKLLANFAAGAYFCDPETYKESDSRVPAIFVEYATWLFLTNPPKEQDLERFEGPGRLAQLGEALTRVVNNTHIAWSSEYLDKGREVPSDLDALIFKTRLQHLNVRNPTYPFHQEELVRSLFAPVDEEVVRVAGVSIDSILAVERAVGELTNERANEFKKGSSELRERWKAVAEGRVAPKNANEDEVARIGAQSPGEIDQRVGDAVIVLLSEAAPELFLVTPAQIQQRSGLPEEAIEKVLRLFSLEPGLPPVADSRPSVYDQIVEAPIVRVGEQRFFAHLYSNLIWAIQPRLEGLLKKDQQAWQRYERHRSDYLENRSISLFKRISPHFRTWRGLHYTFDDGDGVKEYELDGLLVVDSALFLLEAKAGGMSPAARRGARSVLEDLKHLVGEAHEQALRARRYIESCPEAVFAASDGSPVRIRRQDFRRVMLVTTTLDDMSAFVTRLSSLVPLGIIPQGDLSWSVYIEDLRVIADMVEGAGQLVNYLERRARAESQDLYAHGERDWFGHYLKEGLFFEDPEVRILLHSYTAIFDDFYLHEAGIRRTPAERPRQKMPEAMRTLLTDLERSGTPGFVDAAVSMLDAADESRELFAKIVAERRQNALKHGFSSARIPFGKRLLVYCERRSRFPMDLGEYAQAVKYDSKADEALVICRDPDAPGQPVVLIERSSWREDAQLAALAKRALGPLRTAGLPGPGRRETG